MLQNRTSKKCFAVVGNVSKREKKFLQVGCHEEGSKTKEVYGKGRKVGQSRMETVVREFRGEGGFLPN